MVPVKFLVFFVLCLEISDAHYLKKSFKDLSNDGTEDFQTEIRTYRNSLGREVRLQDLDRYSVDDIAGSEDTLWNVEDETQRELDGTSVDEDETQGDLDGTSVDEDETQRDLDVTSVDEDETQRDLDGTSVDEDETQRDLDGTSVDEDETQRDLDGTSEDVDDPAKEEEKLEEITNNGGDLLDQDNVNQDSTLAKMIESMIVEVNGKDKKPKGLHPESDRKEKEDSMDMVKYTHQQLVDMGVEQEKENDLQRNFEFDNTYWEKGIVPYTIKGSLSNTKERKIIETAIKELARKTCIQLVPKGSTETQGLGHTTYIEFIDSYGCWSFVGRFSSGSQHISLQNPYCVHHSIIQHEIMHAIGMWHEQSRLDRDNYIRILKGNVEEGREHNFDKHNTSDTRPYDAESVMQYNLYAFGKPIGNRKAKTIEFIDKDLEFLADLDAGLDFYDVADITDAYQCAAHCKGSSRPKCENGGFVDHNCKCFCPSGLKGGNCQTVETSSACGGIVYVSELYVTEIRTPNWPSPYPVGTKCTWLIKAPADMYVKLTADELSLPHNTLDRCYHWMEVRYNLIGQLGVKICGGITNRTWTTTPSGESNLMMVRFDAKFAEDRDPEQGFRISATAFSKDSTVPSDPLTCTFEPGSSCFLMNDPNAKLRWKQQGFLTPSGLLGTGPYRAKQGQYYSYMESSLPASTGQRAIFVMKNEIYEAKPRCLSFYYSMHGATMGSLEVYRKGTGIPKDRIFIKEGDQGNQWKLASISIQPVPGLQIYIEAVRGSTHLSDIGIDDVKLITGYCNMICTFESNDPDCFFDLSKGDYSWDIIQGRTLSSHTGPSKAHSGQFYAYLEASYRRMGGTAVMSFKVPPMANDEYCMSFAYNMHGGSMGELTVQNGKELWTKKGNQGHSWKEAKVTIKAETGDLIQIVATLGSDYTSDIAVDDIFMKEGAC